MMAADLWTGDVDSSAAEAASTDITTETEEQQGSKGAVSGGDGGTSSAWTCESESESSDPGADDVVTRAG